MEAAANGNSDGAARENEGIGNYNNKNPVSGNVGDLLGMDFYGSPNTGPAHASAAAPLQTQSNGDRPRTVMEMASQPDLFGDLWSTSTTTTASPPANNAWLNMGDQQQQQQQDAVFDVFGDVAMTPQPSPTSAAGEQQEAPQPFVDLFGDSSPPAVASPPSHEYGEQQQKQPPPSDLAMDLFGAPPSNSDTPQRKGDIFSSRKVESGPADSNIAMADDNKRTAKLQSNSESTESTVRPDHENANAGNELKNNPPPEHGKASKDPTDGNKTAAVDSTAVVQESCETVEGGQSSVTPGSLVHENPESLSKISSDLGEPSEPASGKDPNLQLQQAATSADVETQNTPTSEGTMGATLTVTSNPSPSSPPAGAETTASKEMITNTPPSMEISAPGDSKSVPDDPAPSVAAAHQQENGADQAVDHESRVARLEDELANAESIIASLRAKVKKHEEISDETASLMMEIQDNLQQQMSLRAEAENKARLAEAKCNELKQKNKEQLSELQHFRDMEKRMLKERNARDEAEIKVNETARRLKVLEEADKVKSSKISELEKEVVRLNEEKSAQEKELIKAREERDEEQRKQMSLTSRLNAAKKNEAVKANLADQYEQDIQTLEHELKESKKQVEELTARTAELEEKLKHADMSSSQRVKLAETSLAEERRLNDERKKKMKLFVENKSEELRQAKADNASLQEELNHANRSLMDLNNRWKQLHAQWVQSQTRNRELQRDLNRQKKDSENLHKFGDTLEMKLSRSANETEEHKSKRLAAKHELMTVLRTLESERAISQRLRDSLKFTFTPKALSQQQLLKESLEDFENQLMKLSRRLGRPIPPAASDPSVFGGPSTQAETTEEDGTASLEDANGDRALSRIDMESRRLISKLEYETQRVSQCIMALTGGIERLQVALDSSGQRNCFSALSEIITTGAMIEAAPADHEETRRFGSIRSNDYGHITPS